MGSRGSSLSRRPIGNHEFCASRLIARGEELFVFVFGEDRSNEQFPRNTNKQINWKILLQGKNSLSNSNV